MHSRYVFPYESDLRKPGENPKAADKESSK